MIIKQHLIVIMIIITHKQHTININDINNSIDNNTW